MAKKKNNLNDHVNWPGFYVSCSFFLLLLIFLGLFLGMQMGPSEEL
jgi:hypothetical protein